MDKIKTVKIKNEDGSISEESYTISVDAKNVDMENGKDLQDTVGEIDIDKDGNISNQLTKINSDIKYISANISNLNDEKIDKIDIVNNLESNNSNKVLSAAQGKILNDKIEDACEFIFPGRWGYNTSCNINIIRYKNKVIVFDTGSAWAYDYVKTMFHDYGIDHIDYIIVTHFHADHIGNLISFIEDHYIDNNTIYYHPACPSEIYTLTILNQYNEIETLCENNNILSIIPDENQAVSIFDDLTLRFGNCDTNYTINNYTDGNQASMVIEINHNNFRSLIMGDAQSITLQHLFDINFIKGKINFYTIPHHSINTTTFTRFYDLIHPDFAVGQIQMVDYVQNKHVLNQDSAILNECNCQNYYSCINEENLYFIETFGSVKCIKGIPTKAFGKSNSITNIYVDANINIENKQDGSINYPFRDLSQAISSIADYNNRHINIILAPGHYGNLNPSDANNKNRINILNWKNSILITTSATEGDRIIDDGILIENCFKVKLENLIIKTTTTRNYCANIVNSNAYFNNCIFTNYEEESKGLYGLLINEYSNCNVRGCSFSYLTNAISCRDESIVDIATSNFNNLTRLFDIDTTAQLNIHSFGTIDYTTIDNINNYNVGIHSLINNDKIISISNTKMLGDINLPFTVNNIFENIEIEYEMRWNNNQVGRGRRRCSLSDLSSYSLCDFNLQATGSLKLFSCFINISYTNGKLTISRNTAGSLDSGVITLKSPEDADDDSYGIKIKTITIF